MRPNGRSVDARGDLRMDSEDLIARDGTVVPVGEHLVTTASDHHVDTRQLLTKRDAHIVTAPLSCP